MERIVGMHEAKTQLSSLVAAALAGDDVVLSRSGVPVARIVPIEATRKKSIFGFGAGKIPEMTDSQWEESDRALAAQFER
jgi:prevent-host-death family protein